VIVPVSLSLSEDQHARLRAHLFPGDGLEAVAFLACGYAASLDRRRLVVRSVHLIDHAICRRSRDRISWPGEAIEDLLDRADLEGLSLVKVHSHPQGYPAFSRTDDESDRELLPAIAAWVEADTPHGSAIMLPDGRLFGRAVWGQSEFFDFAHVNVVGPDIRFWWQADDAGHDLAFSASQDQAFGEGTTRQLQRLKVAIIGASGTGSPVLEQLVRLGVGEIVLVDDDVLEDRNLNRILFATAEQAEAGMLKVTAAEADVHRKGLPTKITPIAAKLGTAATVRAVASCDAIFGCVDSIVGRFHMNLIASHYIQPYFDLGILLDAVREGAERGRIKDILGTVHYLVPGRSSLLTRDVFTLADVAAEGLHASDPDAAARQVEDKYIKGLAVRRPAVVSVNMFAAALAVNDFLARLHPYRRQDNAEIASIEFSLGDMRLTTDEEVERCPVMGRFVGHGDRVPLLGLPEIGE
jgi:hypothetical protein